ncbi:hypothetical protein [Nocardioides sp. Root140]|uniref:hypothetical protein n=1 Tax=Nocardioides sp. Root140 TaxID=1736460 RepID=UPI0006F81203|nr:hypothetical protein [Nocardioides sp. Root140]KQY63900.1 hypothetical protein ASD30_02650 [Nocardioides sp. Root140]
MKIPAILAGSAVLLVAAACGTHSDPVSSDDNTTRPAPGTSSATPGERRGLPATPLTRVDPTAFVTGVDNPFLPLEPGTVWTFRSSSPDEETRIVTTVTDRSRVVQGVRCVVVHDVESTLDGEVLEDTWDWYAQDVDGNVWYFGEDTTAYEDGTSSKEGSWETGVDGAQAGIVMPADPQPGDEYAQEFYAGEAEDRGQVLRVDGRHPQVPATYGALVVTRDTTPLEPKLVERKYYARGVGVVHEETVRGGRESVRLVSVRPNSST